MLNIYLIFTLGACFNKIHPVIAVPVHVFYIDGMFVCKHQKSIEKFSHLATKMRSENEGRSVDGKSNRQPAGEFKRFYCEFCSGNISCNS